VLLKVVADQNIPMASQVFSAFGPVTLVDGRSLSQADLLDADILLVRSVTQVNKALLNRSTVRFVGSATAGFEHIDLRYLRHRGIHFSLASGANAQSVVEYVFAALAVTDERLEGLLNGEQSLGVIGYGNVGRRLVDTGKTLGIRIKTFDPFTPATQFSRDFGEVLRCDVVSLHCELTSEGAHPTQHLVGREALKGFSKEQLLINAARGSVVDNAALLSFCETGKAPQLILDCWENEPDLDRRLIPFCHIATPHIAGYSTDGKWRATQMLFDDAARVFGLERGRAPFPERDCIQVDGSAPRVEVIRDAISCVYDIKADDERFRADAQANRTPTWFDDLRRQYPVRRELAEGRITSINGLLSEELTKAFRLRLED
jgi:erythronate-4-phosphate dehydrogenase